MDTELEIIFYARVASALIVILFPVFIYWYSTRNYNYWKNKGIPFIKPYPYFIYFLEIFRRGMIDVELERYKKYGRIYGYNEGNTPLISVGDPELIKNMVVKDFQYFTNKRLPMRYVIVGITDPPIGDTVADKMLTVVRGEEWKRIRTVVALALSTGKIKRVMYIVHDSAKTLLENIRIEMAHKNSVELISMYGGFTMDVITSTAFSTKVDSLKNPENVVVQNAKAASSPNLKLHFILICLAPKIMKMLGFELFSPENKFFKKFFQEVIGERRRTGQTRNDFLQLMMDIAKETENEEKSEEIEDGIQDNYKYGESNQSVPTGDGSKHLTMDELLAQCVLFLLAGYHTSKVTLSAATYLLALHQDEQEKVFNEIKEVLRETDGVLTYEAVQKMKYLECVISETLRMYPPPIKIERQAEIDYKLGDTGITIPKGMAVSFPIFPMHRDPEFFPEPEKFRPTRFSPKERENITPYTYLPFGFGPRNCVGMRFALLELKICLVHVLSVFHVQKCPETKVPLELGSGMGALNLAPIHVRLVERKECPLVLES